MVKEVNQDPEVEVDSLDADGLGGADWVKPQVTLPLKIRNGLPGETVQARILKKRRGIRYAEAISVANPSADRVPSACEYFPRCGGCSLHHLHYDKQLSLKHDDLAFQLSTAGVVPESWQPPVSDQTLGYRTKARLGVRQVGDNLFVGFRESFSNRVGRMNRCEVLTPTLGHLIEPLKVCISRLSISAQVPQIEVAQGDKIAGREALSTILMLRHLQPLCDADIALLREFANHHSITWLLQSGGYDTLVTLAGKAAPSLKYFLSDQQITIEFGAEQFTQVNRGINQKIINRVLSYLEPLEETRVLDLFCGVGNFSLPLAAAGAQVVGLEFSATAIHWAKHNAVLNQLDPLCHFDVVDLYAKDVRLPPADVWIFDPPRSGIGANLQLWLPQFSGSQIVYVSCNPKTFATDAKTLIEHGFKLREVGIFDMFPHTAHVETVGFFYR